MTSPERDRLTRGLAAVRDSLLIRDAQRLDRTLAGRRFDAARFESDVARALTAAENRQRLRPTRIDYPEELPVVQARRQLRAR